MLEPNAETSSLASAMTVSRTSSSGAVARTTGGTILVDALGAHGVEHAFCVPGESFLAVLDALYDSSIELTVCRQEGGAAMMAEAAGKLTGRPGVCFVTRGPGATNAAPGVHVAAHDSTPMVLFIGQVERAMLGREAFQEVDYKQLFGGMAKLVLEVDDPARIPEFVSRAFHVATSGRPGPVVVSLPEDVLNESCAVKQAGSWRQIETHPGLGDMGAFLALLKASSRPVAILGGSRWTAAAKVAVARFVERYQIPTATSFRRHSLFPADHRCYTGELGVGVNPKLKKRVQESDLVLLIGGRLSELASDGYTLLGIPQPSQVFVHVHPGAEELGRVYRPTLGIHASPAAFAEALECHAQGEADHHQWLEDARADYIDWSTMIPDNPGDVQMGQIISWLQGELPEDAILSTGGGNYAGWVQRFYRFSASTTLLAPTSGSMGYGVPAAVCAKRLHPDRVVVSFAGDGCFLMNGQEFATAVLYKLPIIVIVVNNGIYGTIRMHQEREYPGRVIATSLANPDFAQYARAFGGHGETVVRTDEFAAAFGRALASGKPAIIEVQIAAEAISTTATLSGIRRAALLGRQ